MKLRLAPGRVAVKKKDAKLKGNILLPPARNKLYEIGEVVEVGDLSAYGHEGKSTTLEKLKKGDIVLFQLPLNLAAMVAYELKGVLHVFLNFEDIIARLNSDTIAYENFQVIGRFMLLEPSVREPSKLIVMPDNAQEARQESLHFSMLQKGADVKADLLAGQEVFPDKGRVNHISIERRELVFVDQQFILGCLESNGS